MAKTKICSACKKKKSWDNFYLRSDRPNPTPQSECKECGVKRSRKYYHKHTDGFRKKHLRYKFGLTIKDYDKLYNEQSGCCAVCEKHQSELKRALAVDHNHETGQIRGLLCSGCNPAIGALGADYGTDLLQKAIRYVEKY